MYELDPVTIVAIFIATWSIGLFPPILIRYAILKRPIAKWPAIGTCALFWVINIVLFTAMGSKSKTHFVLTPVAKKKTGGVPLIPLIPFTFYH